MSRSHLCLVERPGFHWLPLLIVFLIFACSADSGQEVWQVKEEVIFLNHFRLKNLATTFTSPV